MTAILMCAIYWKWALAGFLFFVFTDLYGIHRKLVEERVDIAKNKTLEKNCKREAALNKNKQFYKN